MSTSNETEVSDKANANTRKNGARIESEILRCLADVTGAHAAACMGVHESTISRMKERIGEFAQLLAALNLQIAATDSVVVNREDQLALKRMAFNWLRSELADDRL